MNPVSTALTALSGISSLVAIVVALRGIRKDRQTSIKEAAERAAADAAARAEATATQKQILAEQREMNKVLKEHLSEYGNLRNAVTKIGDRAEEAHRRIDKLEGQKK